jgi:hypothetical protein
MPEVVRGNWRESGENCQNPIKSVFINIDININIIDIVCIYIYRGFSTYPGAVSHGTSL